MKGDVDLTLGNGAKVTAVAVGVVHLRIASDITLELNNCYFVPSIIIEHPACPKLTL